LGDFNTVRDPRIDAEAWKTSHKSHELLNDWISDNNLIDAYRLLHPKLRQFSISPIGENYGKIRRLDHYFIDSDLLQFIKSCDYGQ